VYDHDKLGIIDLFFKLCIKLVCGSVKSEKFVGLGFSPKVPSQKSFVDIPATI